MPNRAERRTASHKLSAIFTILNGAMV